MKFVYKLFALILLATIALNAPAQSWESLITDGGSSGNEVYTDMHIDAAGNVYLTGNFSGSASIGNTLLTSNGASDFFVIKYDSAGNLKYSISAGTSAADFSNSIVSDNNGNVYITGQYSSFWTVAGVTLTLSGPTDIFTLKIDTTGNIVWAKKAGGLFDVYANNYKDRGIDIAFDNTNGIYVAGVTSGQLMTFGPFLHGPGQGDATDFVGKYDLNGNEQWIVSGSNPNITPSGDFSIPTSLVYNPTSNSIVAGGYNNILVTIGGGGVSENNESYLRQIQTNGTLGWYRQFGGLAQEEIMDLDVDAAGNIYAAGLYNGTLEIPLGTTISTSINDGTNAEISDAFILKFNSNASSLSYIKTVSGSQDVDGLGIASSPGGNLYVTGRYKGTPGIDNVALNPKGEFDIFLIRIDSTSNLNWVETAGGSGDDQGINVDVTNNDKIILSGGFSSISEFGKFTRTSLGFSDAFLATLDCKPGIPNLANNVDTVVCIGDSSEIIPVDKFGTDYSFNLLSGGTIDTSGNFLKILWTSPGNHQVQIIPSNVCGQGEIKTINFQINDTPGQTTLAGDTNICLGLGTYNASNPEANNFFWSLSGGGSLVPLNNQALISWSSPGQYFLSVSGENECGLGQEDSISITVAQFPSAPILISGNNSSCLGTDTFTINTQLETNYTWDLSGGGFLSDFDSFAIVNWNQPGTHILRVIPANICGTGNASSIIVNVSSVPTNEDISGDSIVCLGSSSLSLPVINGANYNWAVSGGGTLLNLGNTAIINWNNPGDYFVTASIQNTCGTSSIDTFNISVKTSAIQPGPINGSNSVCIGTQNYSVSPQSDQTYEWSLSSGGNLNFVNNQASVNWTQLGFHTITVTALNDCGQGLSRNLVVEVKDIPNQPGVIFGNDEVCLGLENYNVFAESGISYNWSISGGGQIFPSGNSVSVNWTLPGTYDLIITPSNTCGNGTPRILSIEVKDVPDDIVGINGLDTVCLGNQIYTIENPQTGDGIAYSWSLSGGGLIAPNGNTASINWTSPGTYTLSVQAQNSCGFSQSFSKFINVRNTSDQISSISGDDEVCLDTSIYSVPLIGGFNYNWNLSGGGILSADSNQAQVLWQNTGDFTLTVSTSDGCSKSLPIEVKDLPVQPSAIGGDTLVCLGSKSYAVQPEVGQTFNWSISGGGSISAFGNAAIVNWNAIGNYNLNVSASNLCGTGPDRQLAVNVLSTPLVPQFDNPDTLVCKGTLLDYDLNQKPFETYNWTLNRGGLLTPQDSFASINWLDTGISILSVNASNLCGTGSSASLEVEVDDVPAIPTIAGPTQVCLDTNLYSTAFDNNVTYNWSITGTAFLNDSLNNALLAFSDTGNYTLDLSLSNSCGQSLIAQKDIEVFQIPSKPELIQGDTIVCLGFNSYQVEPRQNQTFNWSISGGGAINALGNSATINWTNTGNYQIYIQASNLCGNGAIDTIDVEVRTTPAQPASIFGDINVCLDSTVYSVNPINNVSYSWSLSGNGNLISGDSSNALVSWSNTGLSVISVTASNLCGSSPSQSKSINISDIPGIPNYTSGDTLVCLGNETYQLQPSTGLSYNWNLAAGGTVSPSSNQAIITWNQTGNWDVITSLSNFCGTGPVDTLSVRVKTLPDTVFFINPDTLVCLSNVVYNVNLEPELSYSWSLNGGGSFSSVNNQAFVTWSSPGIYSLQVTPVNICGSGPSSSVQVDVNTIPNSPQFLNLDTLSCLGPDTYTAIPQSNVGFLWNLSGGGGSTSSGNQLDVNWTSTGIFDIELRAFNFCGTSSVNTKSISVNEIPDQPVLLSGNQEPCLDNEVYTVASNNATGFIWNLSGGGLLSPLGDSALVNWISPGNQNINVFGENYCGSSQALNLDIDISDVPERPSNLTGATSLCLGDAAVYTVDQETGLAYEWRIDNGASISSDSSTVSIDWTSSGEQLILVKALNICGTSPETDLEVNVRTVPVFQGNILGSNKICVGSQESYSVSFSPSFSYNWNLDKGGEISAQENNALINWNNNGQFDLSLSAENSCGVSEPIFKQITVDSFPVQPKILVQGDSLTSNFERDNVWYLNGEILNNETQPFIIPTETGQYTLQIINSCGESDVSDFISFYGGENLEDEIYLFPNPANTTVRIKIPLNLNLSSLKVINSDGRRIAGISLEGNSVQDLDIDYLRPGVYFIELNIEGQGNFYKKLVVN